MTIERPQIIVFTKIGKSEQKAQHTRKRLVNPGEKNKYEEESDNPEGSDCARSGHVLCRQIGVDSA